MRILSSAAVLTVAGCSFYNATTVTPDLITLEYDAALYSAADMQPRADAHCARTGRRAQVAGHGGKWAVPSVTFQCVPR